MTRRSARRATSTSRTTLTPQGPVWKGFGPATFKPAVDPLDGRAVHATPRTASRRPPYELSTDQFGTQLDPPAHWAPEYPGIDELPATYAVRPLVVISIVAAGRRKDPKYALQVSDIRSVRAAQTAASRAGPL